MVRMSQDLREGGRQGGRGGKEGEWSLPVKASQSWKTLWKSPRAWRKRKTETFIKTFHEVLRFTLLSPRYRWVKVEGLAGSRLHSQAAAGCAAFVTSTARPPPQEDSRCYNLGWLSREAPPTAGSPQTPRKILEPKKLPQKPTPADLCIVCPRLRPSVALVAQHVSAEQRVCVLMSTRLTSCMGGRA